MTADVLGIFAQAPIDACDRARAAEPAEYAAERADELARLKQEFGKALDARLAGTAETLYTALFGLSEGWAPERRAELLVRYLGFPYWDVLLFPLQSVADAGERDTIEVVRMSPRDAKLLPPLDPDKPKQLAGFETMHFGAFFDRGRARERLPLGPPRRRRAPDRARARRRLHRRRACGLVPQGVRRHRRGGGRALGNAKPLLDHVRAFARARRTSTTPRTRLRPRPQRPVILWRSVSHAGERAGERRGRRSARIGSGRTSRSWCSRSS